jgi:hypothetical protein
MTDYVKSTNFASKDSLASGNPLKIVKGLEIDIEFNNIAAAIATKSNGIDTALTGTPTAPTAAAGTNTSQIATTAFVTTALQSLYPVGSIYINAGVSTNPATLLGFGTWTAFGAGRVMVGLNGSDSLFDALEETGGSKDAVVVSHNHTASTSISDPGHRHLTGVAGQSGFNNGYGDAGSQGTGWRIVNDYGTGVNTYTQSVSTGISASTSVGTTGSSGTNANLQPYITVAMWKRTA